MEDGNRQPLLSPREKDESTVITTSSFTGDSDDIPPITGAGDFCREFYIEFKKLWYLAAPSIFTLICQYLLCATTQVFSGHVSIKAQAAFSVENYVVSLFTYGIMLGMGSALETLCGQAYGAGQIDILEMWYFMLLVLFAGYLENAEVSVDALSICMNILGWAVVVGMGMNAAISVRVSNELGAGHPRSAKISLVVAVISGFLMGLLFSLILIITRDQYPVLFSSNEQVRQLVKDLTPLLAFSILINSVQPVLSGVAIGSGWQATVAYVNISCYYLLGIPLGVILAYKFDWGIKGIWWGMNTGTIIQTCVLFWIIYKTNWNKEASIAEDRIRKWGGDTISI
ncbi:hypothetical protein Q3G72_030392 [Acer saccharum]|nr:hypothetical protein Q3G72_030392 [Acer saccharum]